MGKLPPGQEPDAPVPASHHCEPAKANGDLRRRIRSLFALPDEKRPPQTPSPTPAGARTAANSEDGEFGLSSATVADLNPAQTSLSSFRTANPAFFANNYDGPAGHSEERSSGPRRRSIQRGHGDNLGSEGDGQSISTPQQTSIANDMHRGFGSVKESSNKYDSNRPRRVKSTLTKQPTFPRRSLYNLKGASSGEPPSAEKRSQQRLEEPKLRVNHVPGSFRSEYDASIRSSRSSSPASGNNLTPVTIEPLLGRSFEAVSSRGSSINNLLLSDPTPVLPPQVSVDADANKDQGRPATAIPFLRPMLSSYTLQEKASTSALRASAASQPVSLKSAIDNCEGQPPDADLARAIEASSNQALTPDLKPESAVAAVDFQKPGTPSSSPQPTVQPPVTSRDFANASPQTQPVPALSNVSLHVGEQPHAPHAAESAGSGSRNLPPEQRLRQLPPSPVHDGEEARELVPSNEPDSKQHWMRQLLGQKSAPVMGQSPPNLTARPHHRSRKVTKDLDLQRSNTVPVESSKATVDWEELRGPESFTRIVTDLEGLLQQALQLAGGPNNKATEGAVPGRTLSPNVKADKQQEYVPQRATSDESSDSSDSSVTSDSSGLDEEQNRTSIPVRHGGRHGHRSNVEEANKDLFIPDRQMTNVLARSATIKQPLQVTVHGDAADVQNMLRSPVGVTSSSVDTTDWTTPKPAGAASRRYPEPGDPPNVAQKPSSVQPPANDTLGSMLRERRPSKMPAPAEINNPIAFSEPRSFSSEDDKEPIAFFNDRPAQKVHQRGPSRRRRVVEEPPVGSGPLPREDVLTPLPSDIGGRGPGSDPKSLDLKHRHHFSIREPKMFSLSHAHRRSRIARDWSTSKKRWVALVACINTALMGLIIGIYAGEVPAIQYNIVDEHHYTILGNVVLFIGLAITTSIFWPLPLLYGRKPFTLAALAILMPLQFPQAVAVSGYRTPYTPTYRVSLLLSRAVAGLVMGFANINFIATLLDLFGASLQSVNPHQEVVDANDVRRHGGGMGIWLGIWTWSFIGSIGVGFFVGALIISQLDVDWGFWITIILTAFVLVLNVLIPEVRRSPYRRSVAEIRTPTELTRRVARGEVMMHLYSTGPKWWVEEVVAGSALSLRMLKQPGFMVLSTYIGWIYGQIVMIILVCVNCSMRSRSPC